MAEQIVLPTNPRFQNLSGRRFGRLIVQGHAGCRGNTRIWTCLCDCGSVSIVGGGNLNNGHTRSCGCLETENRIKHGMAGTPIYKAWQKMKDRCENPSNKKFQDYGGRGITVCKRWINSFEHFYADLGPRTSPKHSIDRIDNDGNYEPGNCRWATRTEQLCNRRTNRFYTIAGETYCLSQWSIKVGVRYETIRKRLSLGWSIEEALNIQPQSPARRAPPG